MDYLIHYRISYSLEKNATLLESRRIGFEDIITLIKQGKAIAVLPHPSARYPHQEILAVDVDGYAYLVPFVVDHAREELFLKTIYPSRKATKRYRRP